MLNFYYFWRKAPSLKTREFIRQWDKIYNRFRKYIIILLILMQKYYYTRCVCYLEIWKYFNKYASYEKNVHSRNFLFSREKRDFAKIYIVTRLPEMGLVGSCVSLPIWVPRLGSGKDQSKISTRMYIQTWKIVFQI